MARAFALGVLFLFIAVSPAPGQIDSGPKIEPLDRPGREKLDQQRELVASLARRYVGSAISGTSLSDLRVIQQLFDRLPERDRSMVPFSERSFPDRRRIYEVQALGVALGDVMAHNLDLEWVIFKDEYGRGRALNARGTMDLVFPVTILSKRYEKSLPVDVRALYEEVAAMRPKAEPGIRGR